MLRQPRRRPDAAAGSDSTGQPSQGNDPPMGTASAAAGEVSPAHQGTHRSQQPSLRPVRARARASTRVLAWRTSKPEALRQAVRECGGQSTSIMWQQSRPSKKKEKFMKPARGFETPTFANFQAKRRQEASHARQNRKIYIPVTSAIRVRAAVNDLHLERQAEATASPSDPARRAGCWTHEKRPKLP